MKASIEFLGYKKKTLPCTDCGKPMEVSSLVCSVTCADCVEEWSVIHVDAKTLLVGDKVSMGSGCYGTDGHVIRVGPLGVDVQTDSGGLFQFNYAGIERDGKSTFECGVWHLVRKLGG